MRTAPRSNLTITLIRHQSFGADRLLGIGPKSLLALPMAVAVERAARVDVVALSQASAKPELLGYPHSACACACVPEMDLSPTPKADLGEENASSKKDEVPPPPRPNPAYDLPDVGGMGLLDLLA